MVVLNHVLLKKNNKRKTKMSRDLQVRELAYKLWQVRSASGTHTTPEQDWYDAEKMVTEEPTLQEEGIVYKVLLDLESSLEPAETSTVNWIDGPEPELNDEPGLDFEESPKTLAG